ncbi:hypothetical protein PG988_003747 [Apiospora saccharicola]
MHVLPFPAEIRQMIYEELLVHRGRGIEIVTEKRWAHRPPVPVGYSAGRVGAALLGLGPSILRVSRQTHAEASFVLYARNRFDLRSNAARLGMLHMYYHSYYTAYRVLESSEELVAAFARGIGPRHAGLVRHISITFPSLSCFDLSGLIRLQYDMKKGSTMLDLIGPAYPNLENIDLCLFDNLYHDHDDSDVKADLAFIDTKLRAMPSLKSIVLPYTGYQIDTVLYKQMMDQEWKVTSS